MKLRENQSIIISLPADRREQSWRFRKANRGEQLAQLPSIRLFFLDFSVPVVQRIEQGFPKGKTPLLHKSADVVSCAQIAAIEPVELLLRSSRVITNLHIFTHPGDTMGDTKRLCD